MLCKSPKCTNYAITGSKYCAMCHSHLHNQDYMKALVPKAEADAIQIGGDHYKKQTIQPWTAMESWMTTEEFNGFLRGNVIKYVARYKSKNGLEDLKKAQHYLQKLIELNS